MLQTWRGSSEIVDGLEESTAAAGITKRAGRRGFQQQPFIQIWYQHLRAYLRGRYMSPYSENSTGSPFDPTFWS